MTNELQDQLADFLANNKSWKRADYVRSNDPVPTGFTCNVNRHISITIMRKHRYYPDEWVMNCSRAGIDTVKVPGTNADSSPDFAAKAAIEAVRNSLESLLEGFPEAPSRQK